MHKGDKLFSFAAGVFAAFVPQGPELFTAADVKELSLFVLKALFSGGISLGVTFYGHRLIKRVKKNENEG